MEKYTYTQLEMPLLETLKELGGKGSSKDVYEHLAKKLNVSTGERDKRVSSSSTHRYWDRMVRWVKENLKGEGLVQSSRKGIWELTEKAKSFLSNAKPGILLTVYEVIDSVGEVQGVALWGEVMAAKDMIPDNSVNLILTSPPYPLLSEKEYGNRSESEYIEWFLPIASELYKRLSHDGSFVLNLGPVFNITRKNSPTSKLPCSQKVRMKVGDELQL